MFYSRFISVLCLFCLCSSIGAQHLYIHKIDADIAGIELNHIQKITFSSGHAITTFKSGSFQSIPLLNIQCINFTKVVEDAVQSIVSFNDKLCYPNPCQNELCIDNNGKEFKFIEIYTIEGKLCRVEQIREKALTFRISLSELNSGIYMCRLIGKNGILTQKIIKQ